MRLSRRGKNLRLYPKIHALLNLGLDNRSISAIVECNYTDVSRRRAKLGLGRYQDPKRQAVESMIFSGVEIVKLCAVSQSFVSICRRRLGLARMKRGRKIGFTDANSERAKEIRELKAAGLTYREIAIRFGISYQRCQQLLRPHRMTYPHIGACAICGARCSLNAHHTDYLNNTIEWLCRSCHGAQHGRPIKAKAA